MFMQVWSVVNEGNIVINPRISLLFVPYSFDAVGWASGEHPAQKNWCDEAEKKKNPNDTFEGHFDIVLK